VSENQETNTQIESNVEAPQTEEKSVPSAGTDLIAESKKYRKRAQVQEQENEKLKSQLAEFEETRLKEQDRYKELSEKHKAELENIRPEFDRLKAMEDKRRESMLAKFPDEERASVENLPMDTLEYVFNKINTNSDSKAVPSTDNTSPRSLNPDNKKWTDMTAEERRNNWSDIVKSYQT